MRACLLIHCLISHDTFRPEHEKFEFEVTTSASDLIRMVWACVNGLVEVARLQPTIHPGLLVMDEPKQQGAHRRDLGTFLRRLAVCGQSAQQVIITTSEEADTFAPLVENLDCMVFDFEAKILKLLRLRMVAKPLYVRAGSSMAAFLRSTGAAVRRQL